MRQSPRFKKLGKIRRLGLGCRWALRLEVSDSSCIEFSKELSLKPVFMEGIGAFSTKTNQGRFYFHWA